LINTLLFVLKCSSICSVSVKKQTNTLLFAATIPIHRKDIDKSFACTWSSIPLVSGKNNRFFTSFRM